MRVLFIRSNGVNPDSRVEKEVSCLLKQGYAVDVLAWDRYGNYSEEESFLSLDGGKSRIIRFGIPASFGGGIKKNLVPLLRFQQKLHRWISKNSKSYDVIHACDFDTAYVSYKVAHKCGIKFVYDIFDFYIDAFNVPGRLKKHILRMDYNIIANAHATIICSEKRMEQIQGSSPKKLVVIHNTPPKGDVESTCLNEMSSVIKIVYVGILAGGRFIKEIADYVKNANGVEFHIGGFGDYEGHFTELSKEYHNIKFYGKLPYKETLQLESECDVMVAMYNPASPNHRYAAPNKFYEALMLGKPLIMAENTGMDEVVKTKDLGEIVLYTEESFREGLERLIARRGQWREISQRMQALYHKEYSWNEMERRLIELYKGLE